MYELAEASDRTEAGWFVQGLHQQVQEEDQVVEAPRTQSNLQKKTMVRGIMFTMLNGVRASKFDCN